MELLVHFCASQFTSYFCKKWTKTFEYGQLPPFLPKIQKKNWLVGPQIFGLLWKPLLRMDEVQIKAAFFLEAPLLKEVEKNNHLYRRQQKEYHINIFVTYFNGMNREKYFTKDRRVHNNLLNC